MFAAINKDPFRRFERHTCEGKLKNPQISEAAERKRP